MFPVFNGVGEKIVSRKKSSTCKLEFGQNRAKIGPKSRVYSWRSGQFWLEFGPILAGIWFNLQSSAEICWLLARKWLLAKNPAKIGPNSGQNQTKFQPKSRACPAIDPRLWFDFHSMLAEFPFTCIEWEQK